MKQSPDSDTTREDDLTLAHNIFRWITLNPRTVLAACLMLLALPIAFIPTLQKDTRSDAFLAPDNPALLYKEKLQTEFGLNDPVVLAIQTAAKEGVYEKETLELLISLTSGIQELDNIDRNRVTSLATENDILVDDDEVDIRPFLDAGELDSNSGKRLRQRLSDYEIYTGNLISSDGTMTLIVAEMLDENLAEETHAQLTSLLGQLTVPPGVTLHLAGEGVISGYLGGYIDSDAMRLNPLAGLIINLVIILAFWRINPAMLSNVIIVATAGITLGVMAFSDVAFFVITNALPVILIGISVADAIHVYSEYYATRREHPDKPVTLVVQETMVEMWRPITLTTITTMCGFLGLYLAAFMPPFKFFGVFAALGVFVAWFFSMTFLPAALVLTSPAPHQRRSKNQQDFFTRITLHAGLLSIRHARTTLAIALMVALAGLWAASQLVIDEDRIELFHPSEPIYRADKAINQSTDGTNLLYVVIESDEEEGLLEPAALSQIEALQNFAESLANVGGTVSIVDYLKQMNKVMSVESPGDYRIPLSREEVAQYLFVYSALGDPTDFEEEIDYEYQTGTVRISLKNGTYLAIKPVMEQLQTYVEQNFGNNGVNATLSGRVSLNYYWFKDLGLSHFAGMLCALALVFIVSALLFRSLTAGLFTLVPVAGSVLLVYASMVTLGMTLGIGSSMFAAVAIGLGVDFAIHTLDRLRKLFATGERDDEAVYTAFYRSTGRALLFNFLAIACGFGVLMSSKIVSLNQFGSIVVLAVSASFIASLTVLPALVRITRPKFMFPGTSDRRLNSNSQANALHGLQLLGMTLLASALTMGTLPAMAEQAPSAEEIVARVNAVPEGDQVTRRMAITMTDRNGKQRNQASITYRKQFATDRKTVMFYESPANIRGTGFLIWNYADPQEQDDQWLYLPALRKARRVSTADRGGYFLGTDFTYEDMKLDGKLEPQDYTFSVLGQEQLGDRATIQLEGTARDPQVAEELGYSRTVSWIDPELWMVLQADFYDIDGKHLKTLNVEDIRQVDGVWTRHKLTMVNHQTGHRTDFQFSDVDYLTEVKDNLFSKQALSRGP